MPSPQATTSLSHTAATARPRLHRGRKVCAWYTRVQGVPRVGQDATGQAFHESARAGMLASPTGSDMAARQRRVPPPAGGGGVVVAAMVAERLGAPLDVVVPRKVGAPGNPELAVGAVADGVQAIDEPAVRRLGLDMAAVRAEAARQRTEGARRTAAYRRGRPPLDLADRTAVLVD